MSTYAHGTIPISTIDDFISLINTWYADNYLGFADKYIAAVAGVQPIPEGTNPEVMHDWNGATIKDLCDFFSDWYLKFNPDLSTGLDYIEKFSWLYYQNQAGLDFVTASKDPKVINPGHLMTQYYVVLNGMKMDSPESKPLADHWVDEIGVDKIKAEYVYPEGGYDNFNLFFRRDLKDGRRPVSGLNDDSVVVSPADAVVNMINDNLSVTNTLLDIKTQKLNVVTLLNNSPLARNFEGGSALSCILMPNVYHHYHSPVSGTVVEAEEDVAGNYFGIDNFPKLLNGGNVGYGYDYSVFEHFRRGYLIIQTEKYGYVATVPVGLNTIGSVVFKESLKHVTSSNPQKITKGDEVGYFQYGGSLNILLFEKGRFPAVRIPQGQIIGTLNEKEDKSQAQFIF